MKRIIAFFLLFVMLSTVAVDAEELSSGAVGAEASVSVASDGSMLVGDIDGDGEINIADATYLQKYLARMRSLSTIGRLRADVDLNSDVESIDVTYLQRYFAHFYYEYYIGMTIEDARAALLAEERRRELMEQIYSFTRSKGVDISEYNGDVDMNKLKAAGYSFVIIRLGYGDDETDQDDSKFEENVRKAEAAGLDWGAYIYSYALTVGEAKSEVNHTLRMLKGKHPTMPIAFDWEDDSYKQRHGMPSDANVLKIAQTYINGISAAGYYPMIYTGYYWLKGAFNNESFLDSCDIWLAQWNDTYDYKDRPIGMWQYGGETNYIESPYITGLNGMFDKNYSYKNYPVIIQAYGYNNHIALIESHAATGAALDDGITAESENLPEECNGVMGDSLRYGLQR